MARRPATSSLALPWERRGTRIRELLSGGRWRVLLALVLAAAAGYGIWQSVEARAKVRQTRAVITEVRRAVAQFRQDFGRCPYSLRELVQPSRAGTRYLQEMPEDAWGNPLWVRCPGRYDPDGLYVVSAGPSGNFLVDDNIQ